MGVSLLNETTLPWASARATQRALYCNNKLKILWWYSVVFICVNVLK